MSIQYVAIDRDDVIRGLGNAYPVPADAAVLQIPADAGVTDGALVVSTTPGAPGVLWWLIDSTVPSQAAGPVTQELAALVPGSVLNVPPPVDVPTAPYPDPYL